MGWVQYTDSTDIPGLIPGSYYRVKGLDGRSWLAKFVVYEGGEEAAFIKRGNLRGIAIREIYIPESQAENDCIQNCSEQ